MMAKPAVSHYWIFVSRSRDGYWGWSGEDMNLGFDIFRKMGDGRPLWVTHAPTLKEAHDKLDTLARTLPAEYFIRDATNAKIMARVGLATSEIET
jgi:hypothetical protein